MVLPFQSENRVQKKAVAMVIHPLALPGTFLATRCAGGFSSPVTFCNFHSNYITPACTVCHRMGWNSRAQLSEDPSHYTLLCPGAQWSKAAVVLDRNVLVMWYRLSYYSVNQSNERQAEISWELCWCSLDLRTSRGFWLSLITRLMYT